MDRDKKNDGAQNPPTVSVDLIDAFFAWADENSDRVAIAILGETKGCGKSTSLASTSVFSGKMSLVVCALITEMRKCPQFAECVAKALELNGDVKK